MRIFPILAAFFMSASALAAKPADFDGEAWKKLVARAAVSETTSTDARGMDYHSLERTKTGSAGTDQKMDADYLSVVGWAGGDGSFRPKQVEIVVENWTIDAQQTRTAVQWGYVVTLDGELSLVIHRTFVEKENGTVVSETPLDVPALDNPDLLKQVGLKIQEWQSAP